MCVVSAIGDHYRKTIPDEFPWTRPNIWPGLTPSTIPEVSRDEFDRLKKELEKMKKILEVAADYDKKTNQPHCEMDEKVDFLKKIAKAMGVDLSQVFKDH